MRVLPQITTGTTEGSEPVGGVKRLLCTAGTVDVQVGFSFKLAKSKETDRFTIPAGATYKFTAPKGKLFWFIFYYSASASTLDVTAMNMDVEQV